ncbi:MAG: flagellar basal-body MS-ring/collar protein FliF [Pseudomonadota bacterium]
MTRLGPTRLAILGATSIVLLAFFVFIISRMGTPSMTVLYSDLDPYDSGRVAGRLQELDIPFEVGGDSSTIMVPENQRDELLLSLAADGLPSNGTIGNELIDQGSSFGTTSFEQQLRRVRALEGELARTISSIDQVRTARVHIVMPERPVFARERRTATASVLLHLSGRDIANEQISAIRHIVAHAVPELTSDNVSITDQFGRILTPRAGTDDELGDMRDTEAIRRDLETRLENKIESILLPHVGQGRVRAQVTVNMDFDRVTLNAESFDPNGQVEISRQTVNEENSSEDGDGGAPSVSVDENLPELEPIEPIGGGSASSRNAANRTEEISNFVVSRTVENTVRERGVVRRQTVAVLLDHVLAFDEEGNPTYTPRDEEQMQQLRVLVERAVGFDAARGDELEMVNMPFERADVGLADDAPVFLGLNRAEMFRLVEMGVLGIVALLTILLVVRPLVNRMLDGNEGEESAAEIQLNKLLTDQSAGLQRALAGPDSGLYDEDGEEGEGGALIDVSQVEGQVRASAIRKVGEIVEQHPEEAVQVLRVWLAQDT